MKYIGIKKCYLFYILLIVCLLCFPLNSKALTNITDSKSINSNIDNFTVGGLSFSNCSFEKDEQLKKAGIKCMLNNNYDFKLHYRTKLYIYNSSFHEISHLENYFIANPGNSEIDTFDNIYTYNYSMDDIYYYKFEVIIEDETLAEKGVINITPSENENYKDYVYVIDKYDVDIIVNENNTLDVTETIDAYFNDPKHGIMRNIPLKNNVTRQDKTYSSNRTKISNVSVNDKYETKIGLTDYKLQIGDPNKTVTGKKSYVIKYTYDIGKDPLKNADEIYYNIIGNKWDTVIGNVTFKITMPKNFDSSKLGFSYGIKGSTRGDRIKYKIDGNTISGSLVGILTPMEGITVRSELPEGYFTNTHFIINTIDYLIFTVPLLLLLIAFILWLKYGKDDKVIEVINFYPPNNLNSLDVGFLYYGKAYDKGVTSLLVYLANKGYIEISEKTTNSSCEDKENGEDDFSIKKLKDYDGENIQEKKFMEGLFKDGDETNKELLTNNFYLTTWDIENDLNSGSSIYKIFGKFTLLKKFVILLFIITSYLLITIPIVFEYVNLNNRIFAILFPFGGFAVLIGMLFSKLGKLEKVMGTVFGLFFGGVPWVIFIFMSLRKDKLYMVGYILEIICIIGMLFIFKFIKKRTKYGNEMLGQISGFKTFLETAEKERLEALVMENPNYFYDILPYTYVLDVSSTWIDKFRSISVQPPSWYDSQRAFEFNHFSSFISSTNNSANIAMTSEPYSGSSGGYGGFSGGGFSGGGSGGGGGSSW